MVRLEGKVAFITGAGSGIGRATARLFADEGASVAIVEIDPARGEGAKKEILDSGGNAVFLETDITSEESVKNAVDACVSRLGRPTVLFNCAGGASVEDNFVTDVDMAVWDRTMDLDVRGSFLCCRHVIPQMIAAGGGAIVNMSSGAALRGASPAHVYSTAKGAILSFTRALAGRYTRDNIRANAICSGRIMTERIVSTYGRPSEQGKFPDLQKSDERVKEYPLWVGEPVDIAHVALFLASEESRMITGATIQADGGRSSY